MLHLEILAIFGVLATINLALFIAICFSHKRNSLNRINSLKEDWFFTLPKRFIDLADDMFEERIDKKTAYQKLKKISSTYDTLEDLEVSYKGKRSNNLITTLSFNFILLIFAAILSLGALSIDEIEYIIQLSGIAIAFILYFFLNIAKILNFIRTEEDKFQNVEQDLSKYIREIENEILTEN